MDKRDFNSTERKKTKLEEDIDAFIIEKKRERLDSKSIERYIINLEKYREYLTTKSLNYTEITTRELNDYIKALSLRGAMPKTINQHIATLRGFYLFLENKAGRKSPAADIHHLRIEKREKESDRINVKAFMQAIPDNSEIEYKDKLIVYLIAVCGFSGSDICELKVQDVTSGGGAFHIEMPKKKPINIVSKQKPLYELFEKYYNDRKNLSQEHQNIFLTFHGKPLTRSHIIYIIQKICKKISFRNISLVALSNANLRLFQDEIALKTIVDGRLRVEKLISKDERMSLYRVLDQSDNTIKAIRFYPLCGYKSHKATIDGKLETLLHINHASIPKIFAHGYLDEPEGFYILEEYIYEKPIKDISMKLNVREFKNIFLNMLSALSTYHDNGIYHLNIKPENIYYIKEKKEIIPILANLNILRFIDRNVDMQQNDFLIQCESDRNDDPAEYDIYSLGLTMYYLICGKLPSRDETTKRLKYIPISKYLPLYPEYFDNVIVRMLSLNPNEKFKNVQSISNAITNYHNYKNISNKSLIPPFPHLFTNKIKELIENLQNGKTDGIALAGIYGDEQDGCEMLLSEFKSILKVNQTRFIEIECQDNEPALSLLSLINPESIEEMFNRYRIGNSVKLLHDFDYERKKNIIFENIANDFAAKAPIVILISEIQRASTTFIDLIHSIVRKWRKSNNKLLLLYSSTVNNPSFNNHFSLFNAVLMPNEFIHTKITPLSRMMLKNYLEGIFDAKISDGFMDFVYSRSGGKRKGAYKIISDIIKSEAISQNDKNIVVIDNRYLTKPVIDLRDYTNKTGIEQKILHLLALIGWTISIHDFTNIFLEYTNCEFIQIKNSLSKLLNNGYVEMPRDEGGEFLKLIDEFPYDEYCVKMDEYEKIMIHKLLANRMEEKSKFNIRNMQELIIHYYRGEEYSKALNYLLFIVESSLENGFLDDALKLLQKSFKYTDYYSEKEKFYIALINAKILTDMCEFKSAKEELEQIDLLAEDDDDRFLSIIHQARLIIKSGNPQDAITLISNCMEQSKIINTEYEIHMIILKCNALFLISHHDVAFEILKVAVLNERYKAFNGSYLYLLNLYALSFFYRDEFDNALSILKLVHENALINNNTYLESSSLYTTAMIYQKKCDYQNAILNYKKTLEILNSKNDILGKVVTLNSLAIAYQRIANFTRAFDTYRDALTLHTMLGSYLGNADLMLGVASLYLNLGDLRNSLSYIKRAETLMDNSMKHKKGYYFWILANINKHCGEIDYSEINYNNALHIFNNLSMKEHILVILDKIDLLIQSERLNDAEKEFLQIKTHQSDNTPPVIKRMFIVELKLEIFKPIINSEKILNLMQKIANDPSFACDWQDELDYFNQKIFYLIKNGDRESTSIAAKILNERIHEFTKEIPEESKEYFLNYYSSAYTEFPSIGDDKIDKNIFFEILYKISGTLDENILIDRILKYFIFITNSDESSIIFLNHSSVVDSIISKNKYNQTRKREFSGKYLTIVHQANKINERIFIGLFDENILQPSTLIIKIQNHDNQFILCGESLDRSLSLNGELKNLLNLFANQVSLALLNAKKFSKIINASNKLTTEKGELEKSLSRSERTRIISKSKVASIAKRLKFYDEEIIARSGKMRVLLSNIKKMANSDEPILIVGETGTGKEMISRAIHESSKRRNNLFLAENCAAFHDTLLESELFGYVRGSYTGADADRAGIFEIANGGTLFFDEISDMSQSLQKRLLRVLEESTVRRIGGKNNIKINVRIISSTNRDLTSLIKEGKFREDLYYRLNTLSIKVPPLRERREDIDGLILYFFNKYTRENKSMEDWVDEDLLLRLKKYDWPGNVRELENEIQRMVVMSEGNKITKSTMNLFNKL